MIIMNAGVPRSGTILVNAIVRKLLESVGIPVVTANPHGPEVRVVLDKLQTDEPNRQSATIIHTHSWNAGVAQQANKLCRTSGFVNYRDPRDVVVSLMKLHDHDFATAAKLTMEAFRVFEIICHDTNFMIIPYELLISNRTGFIFQIAQRLGIWPSLDEIARVNEETSVSNHSKIMDQVRSGNRKRLIRVQNRNRVLIEDRDTLINDRHIQSGVIGRWRNELSAEHQADATRRFAHLIERYGYSMPVTS